MARPMDIPQGYLDEWQSIINVLARIMNVPSALIMRVNEPDIEVYLSSDTEGNPYEVAAKEHLWGSGLYCETVLKTQDKLLVPDALADENWKNNPDIKLNMISYLGLPIAFPSGEMFGTICVLDNKANQYNENFVQFIGKMRDLVQSHLALVYMNKTLQDENLQLIDYISELKVMRGIIPICSHCKSIRDQDGNWTKLETYLLNHSDADISHGICPDCVKKYYPEIPLDLPEE